MLLLFVPPRFARLPGRVKPARLDPLRDALCLLGMGVIMLAPRTA